MWSLLTRYKNVRESLKAKRSRIKQELLRRSCGKCKTCEYSKSPSALCFHHRNPEEKLFNITGVRLTSTLKKRLEDEADKCDIYCLNCHAELHDQEGWVHENGKRTPK